MIKALADLGLVKFQQGRKESWFVPTKLATNLSLSLTDSASRKEIITFLQQNAHPRVAQQVPSVPENVTDQIRLCEADLNRVEMAPAHYYNESPSRITSSIFYMKSTRQHANLLGGLVVCHGRMLKKCA
ncbi:hypothetical protein SLEP1_g13538 [Rubroshorea leprosula]|uniref:Uncharacterized protein n=1 Tax=Rubroshorea leprosula TaxID=152421 RepID=A0AAV5IQQ9_9ROSI|nr:hypothetical protein SLEP1_g13538 [Rubroshorea leprosula]